jgi:TRAP-type C4-dicarboxylate transport system substrate-binding protein
MEAILVKNKFHELIDKVENLDLIERFYEAFKSATNDKNGVWDTLSPEVQEYISQAYEENLDENNLLTHGEVKKRFSKWFSK